ncbi:hypothetical protein EXU57_15365 [Segetibacter sp. 3557_3]|uniref:hypothetical protein n=1 Tax=Segetibacter sp. 3557_3 TaxID=2547429 RepID=UPI001058B3C4|nr:hypothetical protein [Segetibacter sp. 3557_3]TDH24192.1 hypothetical protein EXU57_15365 [Segetibacter sp. 3557_3]
MKVFTTIAFLVLLACNQKQPDKADQNNNRPDTPLSTTPPVDTMLNTKQEKDTMLLQTATRLLQAMKAKNFTEVAAGIHAGKGVRFVTYGYIDTNKQKAFSKEEFLTLTKQQETRNWGIYDGSGDPINLTLPKYFGRFVYDVDFLNANKTVNKVIGNTAINNIKTVYPQSNFVQYYFEGIDPKFGGMDWKSLIMVFEENDHNFRLVAVIHDQWKS